MAVDANFSISVPELTRVPTEQQPSQAALLNNLNEQAAERTSSAYYFCPWA